MMEYYNLFIDLCKQLCIKEDYANPQKIEKHNAAMQQLKHLQENMKRTNCLEEMEALLYYDDDRVKLNAAEFSLHEHILSNQAILVLQQLKETSKDPTIRFSAQMVLQHKYC